MWAFADTPGLRGVDSANYAAVFLPLLLTTHGKANLARFPGISFRVFVTEFFGNVFKKFLNYFIAAQIRLGFGRKKTGNLFLVSCLWLPLMGGGYSVIIPRKRTCSPRLKRSLCKWACRCPALSFSADCISRLPRLTGSSRFPCSTWLQRFALFVNTCPGLAAR